MAITFNKKSWQSRVSEHPTRRRLTIVDQSLSYSLVDVAREEGNIEAVGDTFDKSTMDDMENRIENLAISAQAECDGLQEQIDNLPSLDETKRVDIGYKETAMNENGGSVKVNPFEIYNGTLAYKTTATQAGSTSQVTTTGKNQLNPASSIIPHSTYGFFEIQTTSQNLIMALYDNDTSVDISGVAFGFSKALTPNGPQSEINYGYKWIVNREILSTSITNQVGSSSEYMYQFVFFPATQATLDTIFARFNIMVSPTLSDYEPYTGGQPSPNPDFPQSIVGIGTEQADHTWSVTVGGVTASGLAYPLYEGDVLDFATGTVYRVNGKVVLNGSEYWTKSSSYSGGYYMGSWARDNSIASSPNHYQDKLITVSTATEYGNNINCCFFDNSLNIRVDNSLYPTVEDFKTFLSNNNITVVYPLATPTIERVTITGALSVIRGFIPSARFIEVGRKYMQEEFVTNHFYELNEYHKGYILQNGTTDKWISYEDSDKKVNSIWTQYGYDAQHSEFLESVAGEIYTPTGSIPVEFKVSDIWLCGANGFSGTGIPSSPSRDVNRLTSNANGFPIELRPVNQSVVASLVVGSPLQFRITGTLWIVLEYDLLRDRETTQNDSQFYDFEEGSDTRNGVHYSKHYIDIEKDTTFNLSTVTTLTNYHFLQASVENPESLDYISFTVTDSNIAITGDDYATGIVLHIEHRKDGETESDLDTKEDIVINVT